MYISGLCSIVSIDVCCSYESQGPIDLRCTASTITTISCVCMRIWPFGGFGLEMYS